MLQGELRVALTAVESRAAVVAKRDASIALITKHLEKALEDKTAACIAPVRTKAVVEGFRSIVNQKNSYECEQESQDSIQEM
jgi:hypothetical protein